MTVEIGILNRDCIVLAADSAITVDNKKVYNNGNKIFQLSKCEPVGIMFYNNARFMGITIEEIVKMYRKYLGNKAFDSLKDYYENFIEYINLEICSNNQIDQLEYLNYILQTLINDYNNMPNEISIEMKIDILSKQYGEKFGTEYKYEDINLKYRENIITYCSNILSKNEENTDKLIRCLVNYLNSPHFKDYTGIVITGYGRNDLFPRMYHIWLEGAINDKAKHFVIEDEVLIDNQRNIGVIKYFAQFEEMYNVVNGINPSFKNFLTKNCSDIFMELANAIDEELDHKNKELGEELKKGISKICLDYSSKYCRSIEEYRENEMAGPMMMAVAQMNKEDLAELAEALIKMTTLKRKASLKLETVGGPIDVAVITKGDGFIWIKRKLYFDKDLNYGFFNKD